MDLNYEKIIKACEEAGDCEDNYDSVNHPSHYTSGCSVECIDMMMGYLGVRGTIDFCLGNAYKYIWRHKLKEKPKEDLDKANWYLNRANRLLRQVKHADYYDSLKEKAYNLGVLFLLMDKKEVNDERGSSLQNNGC